MGPGHEDREDHQRWEVTSVIVSTPQWSPVMKTGKTRSDVSRSRAPLVAAMEPGHEDREDHSISLLNNAPSYGPQWSPAMKTGKTVWP